MLDIMNGYLKNKTHLWAHTMKRSVGPNAKIPLSELYDQYGAKHSLEPGEEFVDWLLNVKLRDRNKWGIYYEDGKLYEEGKLEQLNETKEPEQGTVKEEPKQFRGDNVSPHVKKGMEVADIVDLSVRKAREVVPTIQDLNLLKYAVKEANQLAGKDSLCRVLRKRISDLEATGRY